MAPKPLKIGEYCRAGHLLDDDNIRLENNGKRVRCRTCENIRKGRGEVVSKPREKKTHCKNGHEFTENNTYWYSGTRACKTCRHDAVNRDRGMPGTGPGQGSYNREKTHCPQGHEYTDENTYRNPQGRRWCRACMSNNGKVQTAKKYGLTVELLEEKLMAQGYKCMICSKKFTNKYYVDHDHSCCPGSKTCGDCVRDILCSGCNTALGLFKDSQELLESAIQYLKKFNSDD